MIPYPAEKSKVSRVLIVCAGMAGLALYGYVAFGLGKLAGSETDPKSPVLVYGPTEPGSSEYKRTQPLESKGTRAGGIAPESPSEASIVDLEDQKRFLGSVNGTKYYPRGCGAASRIRPQNTIWFTTADEAEEAGYTQSTSCSY